MLSLAQDTDDDVREGEAWLAEQGLGSEDPKKIAELHALRETAIQLLDGVVIQSSGGSRVRRLRLCGVSVPCRVLGLRFNDGEIELGGPDDVLVTYARRGCRDRWCPVCAVKRHKVCRSAIADKLARVLGTRQRLAFVTFTQVKLEGEPVCMAVDRVMGSWRRLTRRTHWKRTVTGGIRAVEVVYRRAGEAVSKPGAAYTHHVAVTGTHAHVHALVEMPADIEPGDWWEKTLRDWRAVCPGANAGAQDCQWAPRSARPEVIERYAYEVGGYLDPADLYALAPRSPDYVKGVMLALDGRRVLECFGDWRGSVSLAQPPGSVKGVQFARATLANLATSSLMRAACRWTGGEKAGEDLLLRVSRGPKGGLAAVAAALEAMAAPPAAAPEIGDERSRRMAVLEQIRAAANADLDGSVT